MSAATIDHRYYPHLIDAIFAHVDFEGLKAACAAGGAWRGIAECMKERLAHGDITDFYNDGDDISIASQQSGGTVATGHDDEVDFALYLRDGIGRDSRKLFHIVPNETVAVDPYLVHLFKKYVKVVDVPSMGNSQERWACLNAWLRDVPVVRCLSTEWHNIYPLTTQTLVVFQDALAREEGPSYYMEGDFNASHLIINLDCLANPVNVADNMWTQINEFWDALSDDLTVVLHDKITMPSEVTELHTGFIEGYLENSVKEICTVTIVGLELFIPNPRQLRHFKAQAIAAVMETHDVHFSEEERAVRWKFYTHKQYKKLIGEKTYNLYTVK